MVAAPTVRADDDLDKLLDGIPDIPNAEQNDEEDAAEQEVEQEASLPAYVKAVRRAVLEQWEPKAKTIKKNPRAKAQFLVNIDINGQRTGLAVVELSDVKAFDQSVYQAIVAASFPPPPPQILSDVERGVVVTITSRAYDK
jgi:hypothetical protein